MLTAAQIEARRGKLTASACAPLMRGDADGIIRLWRIMTGQEQEEDLSKVWAIRLGGCTEQLSLDWFEEKNRVPVTMRGVVVCHPFYDFAATLDGWVEDPGYPLECKHTGGREPIEVVIERYMPQAHFQMICTNANQAALSIIRGADEPVVEYIDRDEAYARILVERGLQFMNHVHAGTPPVIPPPAPPPVSKFVEMNMAGNDTWRRNAKGWLQTQGAMQAAKECEKVLKSLVPVNAKKCFGDGVRITRDRAGRLSLREDRDERA